jgi:endonuclease/exonuclease/phosphatase family metal-dependent hydrolase
MRSRVSVFLVICSLLAACGPSPEEIAIQTKNAAIVTAANWTSTPTNAPKPTMVPTSTVLPTPVPKTFLDKPAPEHIRLMNYAVSWDSIFPDEDHLNHERREANMVDKFERLIRAVQPDVVCLQEINPVRDPSDVSRIFDKVLPLENENLWQGVGVRDNFIVSKYPLETKGVELYVIPGSIEEMEQAAALVDLPDAEYGDTDLYLVCVHFRSRGREVDRNQRQNQADTIIRQVKDLKSPGDYIDLKPNTPVVIAGDLNVFYTEEAYHLNTLLTGDIVSESLYGEDEKPDWDMSNYTDIMPSHNNEGELFYTWRSDITSLEPGILDRVVYSDSVMGVSNSFVLDTSTLSVNLLEQYSLQAEDVALYLNVGQFHHYPMIVDFVMSE